MISQEGKARSQYLRWKKGERINVLDIMLKSLEEKEKNLFDTIVSDIRGLIPVSCHKLWNFLFKVICTKYSYDFDDEYSNEKAPIEDIVKAVVANSKHLHIEARGRMIEKVFPEEELYGDTIIDELISLIANKKYWLYIASLHVKDSEYPDENYKRILYAIRFKRKDVIDKLKNTKVLGIPKHIRRNYRIYNSVINLKKFSNITHSIQFRKGDDDMLDYIKDSISERDYLLTAVDIGYNSVVRGNYGYEIARIAYFYDNVEILRSCVEFGIDCSDLLKDYNNTQPNTVEYLISVYAKDESIFSKEYLLGNLAGYGYVDIIQKYGDLEPYKNTLFDYFCEEDNANSIRKLNIDLNSLWHIADCIEGDQIDSVNVAEYVYEEKQKNNIIEVYAPRYENFAKIAISRGRDDFWHTVKWKLIKDVVNNGIGEIESFLGTCNDYYRLDILKEIVEMEDLLGITKQDCIDLASEYSSRDEEELIAYLK